MKKHTMMLMGGMLFLAIFPHKAAQAAEQTDPAVSPVTSVSAPSGQQTPADDYSALEKDLKKDRLADALQRIQILEQDGRFLRRRVEMLERDVNDIKNDRYNRVNP